MNIPLSGVANVPDTEKFDRVLQRSERQFDLIKQKYDKLTNPYKDQGQNIRFCTEDVIEVVYKNKEEAIVPNNRTNVLVAAFTTCHARLKLYSYLKRVG